MTLDGAEQDKPEEYYHYDLAGVVVHMGTANSGHYYSYIRPRDGDGEWLEFNDTVVSTFDVKVLYCLPQFLGRCRDVRYAACTIQRNKKRRYGILVTRRKRLFLAVSVISTHAAVCHGSHVVLYIRQR